MAQQPVYEFLSGRLPLLISVPHDGREIPDAIAEKMTPQGRAIPDTDWHVAKLYEFAADLGANILVANYSRYVVDLNRSSDDSPLYAGQLATGLCPSETFSGEAIYSRGAVDTRERKCRIEQFWQPYHERLQACLDELRDKFGYALLWDAHSIPGNVPRLFDGELPLLNLGSNDGLSTTPSVQASVFEVAAGSPFSAVLNGRFKGGYITRHYGHPKSAVHALQLEISQRAYMDEASLQVSPQKLARLRVTLREMLACYLHTVQSHSTFSGGSGSGE